ncbi:hypothetical protein O3P69_009508 [Scylla paramamosain]|uniref:Uncharacterized protein n=1 Tax=Scylla paramamosain TaxID=85552 RepID=A0AAW0SVB7_SCYPA
MCCVYFISNREAIGRQEGGHFAPLVEMISSDSSEEDGGIFTSLKGHLNHTMKIIQDGFKGTVDRLKERVKKKVKQKVKEKMVKPQVPSIPLALAQVQAGDTKQRAIAKLNDTMRATKDKVKTAIGGKVKDVTDKVKAKINSTVSDTKAKAKQKVKDKVKEKASKKLDPTGGHLPTILGVIAAIIITIIVLCIVCCCCCPFCLLYKQRNRGTVHNPNPEVSVMQPLQSQPQTYAPQPYPAVPQQQAPYPTQPMGMQSAPAPYPPQAYPPTGYPGEQPPMYTEKQPPPYNPTY